MGQINHAQNANLKIAFLYGGLLTCFFCVGNRAYYRLGTYPSSQYCFPEPTRCNGGVTFSFFLNILGDVVGNTGWQGFFSTMPESGPGFSMIWHTTAGLWFDLRRDEDNTNEQIGIPSATFMSDYGFNTWVHFLITYNFTVSRFIRLIYVRVFQKRYGHLVYNCGTE